MQSETSKVKAVRGVGLTEDSWFREFSAPASATYFPQAFLIFIYLFIYSWWWWGGVILTPVCSESEDALID